MSLEAILYILLGFLTAVFLALIFLPVLWKRAVYLTERKARSLLPQGIDEVEAQKDQLRAEHAMTVRRLELGVGELREKASQYLTQLHEQRDERNQLLSKSARDSETIKSLERTREQLNEKLATVVATAEQLSSRLKQTSGQYEELQFEHIALQEKKTLSEEQLSRAKIELVARTAQADDIDDDLAKLLDLENHVHATGTRKKGTETSGKTRDIGKTTGTPLDFDTRESELSSLNEDINEKNTRIVALEAELARKTIDDELKAEPYKVEETRSETPLELLIEESDALLGEITAFADKPVSETGKSDRKSLRNKIAALGNKAAAAYKPDIENGDNQEAAPMSDEKLNSSLMSRIREIQSELKTRD